VPEWAPGTASETLGALTAYTDRSIQQQHVVTIVGSVWPHVLEWLHTDLALTCVCYVVYVIYFDCAVVVFDNTHHVEDVSLHVFPHWNHLLMI
jgi:hypothetical protein